MPYSIAFHVTLVDLDNQFIRLIFSSLLQENSQLFYVMCIFCCKIDHLYSMCGGL